MSCRLINLTVSLLITGLIATARVSVAMPPGEDGGEIWEDGEASGDGNEIRGRLFSPVLASLGDDFEP